VCIQSGQHVLHNDRLMVRVADECDLPGKRQALELVRVEVGVQRVEVALGKGYVEPLYTGPVGERSVVDGVSNGASDPPV
jgi:hypothetical protein